MRKMRMTRLAAMGSMLALSACMMPYGDAPYEAPPPAAYTADESPDAYAFIDRADSLWEAIGNAPPDYAFAFEGTEPWAWELQDGETIVVEEAPEGIQTYYFAPGDAGPFLAVRPGRSFGFQGSEVAVVYGPDGGAMPRDEGAAYLDEGAGLYARGRQLRRTMLARQWREVDSQAWIDASPWIWSSVALWDQGRRRHPGWSSHHDARRDGDWRRRLEAERLRRQGLAERFRRWREGGFQGPPPGRFHRPGAGPRPGAGAPGAPGQPGANPPRQPGQSARPHRPWTGRPGLPAGQPVPPSATPGADPAPAPDRPRRGWGGRPRPVTAAPDGATRPPRPEGGRPGWSRPPAGAPDAAATPRPARPEGARPGWFRPRPETGGATPRGSRGGGDGATARPAPPRPSADTPRAQAPRPTPAPRPAPATPGPRSASRPVESDD